MPNKVYVISPEFDATTWAEAADKAFHLDAEIQKLAKNSGRTDVHMHQYVRPPMGATVILVECGADFLKEIEKLSGFYSAQEADPAIPTIRRTDAVQIEPPQSCLPVKKPKTPKP